MKRDSRKRKARPVASKVCPTNNLRNHWTKVRQLVTDLSRPFRSTEPGKRTCGHLSTQKKARDNKREPNYRQARDQRETEKQPLLQPPSYKERKTGFLLFLWKWTSKALRATGLRLPFHRRWVSLVGSCRHSKQQRVFPPECAQQTCSTNCAHKWIDPDFRLRLRCRTLLQPSELRAVLLPLRRHRARPTQHCTTPVALQQTSLCVRARNKTRSSWRQRAAEPAFSGEKQKQKKTRLCLPVYRLLFLWLVQNT